MPNWCYNFITFYSEKKEPVEKLFRNLNNIVSEPAIDSNCWGGDPHWLGNIRLWHFGFKNYKKLEEYDNKHHKRGKIKYRGEICNISGLGYDINGTKIYHRFCITTETAWCEHIKMWQEIIDKFYDGDIKIAFSAEEPMVEYYVKYDPDNMIGDGQFYFDYYRMSEDEYIGEFDQKIFDELSAYYHDCEGISDINGILDIIGINPAEYINFKHKSIYNIRKLNADANNVLERKGICVNFSERVALEEGHWD